MKNSEARKRTEALWAEPEWAPSEHDSRQERALRATRKVYGTAEMQEASALLDAFEDEGLLR